MKSKTSQQLYEEQLEKGTPIENLLRVMVNRADRYQNYYNSMKIVWKFTKSNMTSYFVIQADIS